jgi:hypothetical protein
LKVKGFSQTSLFAFEPHLESLFGSFQKFNSIIASHAKIAFELRFERDRFTNWNPPVLAKPRSEFIECQFNIHPVEFN